MAFLFTSNATYGNGYSVNEVIHTLQERYGFLDNFDNYVAYHYEDIITKLKVDDNGNIDETQLEDILTKLFQSYIYEQQTGIITKNGNGISFIDTATMITTTRVKYINEGLFQL